MPPLIAGAQHKTRRFRWFYGALVLRARLASNDATTASRLLAGFTARGHINIILTLGMRQSLQACHALRALRLMRQTLACSMLHYIGGAHVYTMPLMMRILALHC